jgi:hypothetical protein
MTLDWLRRLMRLTPVDPMVCGTPRSSQWPRARAEHLKEHPACAKCGDISHSVVHHKRPYHLYPHLELDQKNLITLCDRNGCNAHWVDAHFMDWTSFNPDVDRDCHYYAARRECRRKQ